MTMSGNETKCGELQKQVSRLQMCLWRLCKTGAAATGLQTFGLSNSTYRFLGRRGALYGRYITLHVRLSPPHGSCGKFFAAVSEGYERISTSNHSLFPGNNAQSKVKTLQSKSGRFFVGVFKRVGF